MARLFLPLPSEPPARVVLPSDKARYVARVLRLSAGARIEVFDGAGRSFNAEVLRADANGVELSLDGAIPALAARRKIFLVQGLAKADKLEWVIQKGTELGASGIYPVETVRSVVKLSRERSASKQSRWKKIAEEAARQCGRVDVPEVEVPGPLLEVVSALTPGAFLIVLDEEERDTRLSELHAELARGQAAAVVVGPEGGLTREEVGALRALGGKSATLGRRILRTETAGIAALAVLLHLDGELG